MFYQLCFGAGDDERAWLGVGSVKTYRLLNQSSCFQAGVRDENDHTATRSFMKEAGLRLVEQQNIYTVVAAVLHLGNVEFTADEDGETTAHSSTQGEAAASVRFGLDRLVRVMPISSDSPSIWDFA